MFDIKNIILVLNRVEDIDHNGESMNDWMDAESRVEQAHDLFEKGRWQEAAFMLRAAIKSNPHNASWYFNLGLTLEAMEDYSAACDAYQAAQTLSPEDIETLNCLGVCLTRLGRYAQSLEAFEKIQKLDPNYEPCYCNRIVTYTEFGQHDEAEVMFYLARQLVENCPLCYFNIGNSHYMRGNYDHAIVCWRETLDIEADHPQTHSRIADAYWAKGNLEKALEHYKAEKEITGDDSETLLDIGEVLLEMGKLDEAERYFRNVVKTNPNSAAAFFCLGELADKRDDMVTAECCYQKVISLDEKYPGAYSRLARLFLRNGSHHQAVKHLHSELRRCDNDPTALQEIGELLIEAHLTEKAHKVLSKVVKLLPKDAHARHNLAVSCFMMDRLDEGIQHCRKALKINPEYPLALYNLALAHMHKGQDNRARRYAGLAMDIDPKDENIARLGKQLGISIWWTKLRSHFVSRYRRNKK